MLPVKRILCPTDFSDPSYEAIRTGGELASLFSAELMLVHVVSPMPVVPPTAAYSEFTEFNIPSYQLEMESRAEKSLEQIAQERIPSNIDSRTIVVQGDPTEEIVRVAAEEKADMLVIATHGLTGWRRLVFGSVAEKVIRLSPCPVLTIHIRPPEESSPA